MHRVPCIFVDTTWRRLIEALARQKTLPTVFGDHITVVWEVFDCQLDGIATQQGPCTPFLGHSVLVKIAHHRSESIEPDTCLEAVIGTSDTQTVKQDHADNGIMCRRQELQNAATE